MKQQKLMAIGAHADDIELNVGGTLCKYRDAGYDVVYIMSTNNMSGRWSRILPDGSRQSEPVPYHKMIVQRKKEASAAAEFLGAEIIHLDHPQRHYTAVNGDEIKLRYDVPRPECVPPDTPTILTAHEDEKSVMALAGIILQHQPEAIMTHSPIMVDMEHMGTALLVTKAYLKAVEQGYDGLLLYWLDITPTIFGQAFTKWNAFVDVTEYWDQKLKAVGIHACQMPDPSRLDFMPWGEACGCQHAEAFIIGDCDNFVRKQSPFHEEIFRCS